MAKGSSKRSERVVVLLTPDERAAFVAWMLAQGERSESSMVRRLMLEASGQTARRPAD